MFFVSLFASSVPLPPMKSSSQTESMSDSEEEWDTEGDSEAPDTIGQTNGSTSSSSTTPPVAEGFVQLGGAKDSQSTKNSSSTTTTPSSSTKTPASQTDTTTTTTTSNGGAQDLSSQTPVALPSSTTIPPAATVPSVSGTTTVPLDTVVPTTNATSLISSDPFASSKPRPAPPSPVSSPSAPSSNTLGVPDLSSNAVTPVVTAPTASPPPITSLPEKNIAPPSLPVAVPALSETENLSVNSAENGSQAAPSVPSLPSPESSPSAAAAPSAPSPSAPPQAPPSAQPEGAVVKTIMLTEGDTKQVAPGWDARKGMATDIDSFISTMRSHLVFMEQKQKEYESRSEEVDKDLRALYSQVAAQVGGFEKVKEEVDAALKMVTQEAFSSKASSLSSAEKTGPIDDAVGVMQKFSQFLASYKSFVSTILGPEAMLNQSKVEIAQHISTLSQAIASAEQMRGMLPYEIDNEKAQQYYQEAKKGVQKAGEIRTSFDQRFASTYTQPFAVIEQITKDASQQKIFMDQQYEAVKTIISYLDSKLETKRAVRVQKFENKEETPLFSSLKTNISIAASVAFSFAKGVYSLVQSFFKKTDPKPSLKELPAVQGSVQIQKEAFPVSISPQSAAGILPVPK